MTVPAAGTIIGSVITISAVVTDPAHVLDSSVVAVVAHGGESFTVKLDPDPAMAGRYSHQFDTRLFDIHDLYPTVSFRASDLLGNESSIGYTVALDNTPPLADLDPPSHLRVRVKSASIWSCSWEFDPLGSDAVDDGEKTAQIFDVRARVEDRGNTPVSGGADIIPISLVDPARVELLVLDDTTQPLVVDSDGDGVCDKINPLLVPTTTPMSSKDALLVNLVPIALGRARRPDRRPVDRSAIRRCPARRASTPRTPTRCATRPISRSRSPTPSATSRRSGRRRRWSPAGCSAWATSSTPSPTTCMTAGPAWRCAPPTSSATCRSRACCASASTTTASATSARTGRSSRIANTTPMTVLTSAPHGLATGDDIFISRSDAVTANGRWTVTVTGPTPSRSTARSRTTCASATAPARSRFAFQRAARLHRHADLNPADDGDVVDPLRALERRTRRTKC